MIKTHLAVVGLFLLNVVTAAADRPNILLILSDDHAKKATGCYGNMDIKTPALDRIAREGMRFNHALTPNSFCTPARAAVLTGKYSHKNGITHLNQSFDGSQQTFPKLLQGAGYETSLFGKWHLRSQPTGFDFYCVQKMQGMANDTIVFETGMKWIPWSPEDRKSYRKGGRVLKGYNNDTITTEALSWLKNKRDPDKPFCLCLHPKPPHQPYIPPKKYEDFLKDVSIPEPATLLDDYKDRTPEAIQDIMTSNRIVLGGAFKKHRAQLEKANPKITRDELTRAMYQEYIKGYYRLVKSVDDNVGRMLDYLDESGLDKNTIVIYTSDQGFSLGEHGFYNKQWMYEAPLHQPLLVRFPKTIQPGSVHDSMVNHVDLAPTILEFAGINVPGDMQGHSLRGILEGKANKVRDASYYHFYEHGKRLPEMIGIRTATHKLIHYPGMEGKYRWEMFDLENDPEEMNNLSGSAEHKEKREILKHDLRALIKKLDDPVDTPTLEVQASAEAQTSPNVVIIYFDDTGWTDFGCFGGKVDTPHVDRLAAEGMRFTEYYAPAPNCSPSRAGLLTGRFPFRVGMYSYLGRSSVMHLPDSEVTIAEVLKTKGYATGMFGKWHLSGLQSDQPTPDKQGFDYWFACDNNLVKHNPKKLIRNGTPVGEIEGWAAQVVADEANGWMKKQNQPFFAYIAFSETHSPHDAPEELKNKYKERGEEKKRATYKGMTEYSDAAVGSILKALEDMGVSDNTIVFFASDNGPTSEESCEGLRGKKSFTWEGGVRVPAIIRWPGKIKPGSEYHDPVGGVDLMPTLCDIVGAELPNKTIDGVSVRAALEGKSFTRSAPILTFFYRTNPAASMRLGDYTLIAHTDDEARPKSHGFTKPDMPKVKSAKLVSFELYNVKKDVGQKKDLSTLEPQRLAELRDIMIKLHRDAIDEGPVWDLPEPRSRNRTKKK